MASCPGPIGVGLTSAAGNSSPGCLGVGIGFSCGTVAHGAATLTHSAGKSYPDCLVVGIDVAFETVANSSAQLGHSTYPGCSAGWEYETVTDGTVLMERSVRNSLGVRRCDRIDPKDLDREKTEQFARSLLETGCLNRLVAGVRRVKRNRCSRLEESFRVGYTLGNESLPWPLEFELSLGARAKRRFVVDRFF